MTRQRTLLAAAALFGFGGVAMSAAIDHIAGGATPALATSERYHQLYAVLLAAIAFALPQFQGRTGKLLHIAAWLFVIGILLFCGGIYLAELGGLHAFVYAVPAGGSVLMIAWLVMLGAAFSKA